ncbi:MAG: hypothetical protein FWD17_17240 [Polyangiaceae bacterium]|nr:hypothetical protein [Polyangiaceae bacterium]
MSIRSRALDRFAAWVDAPDAAGGIAAFRRAFAGIWLVYDTFDVAAGTTERAAFWLPHLPSPDLAVVQLVLVVCGLALVFGRHVWPAGMIAAVARGTEAFAFYPLNDFFFGSIVYLLLAHSEGGPFARAAPPRWVRDVLLLELAWVYAATGMLKLSPDWLDGGHLFVRTRYLAQGAHWPYPAPLAHALSSLETDAVLAKIGASGELALAGVVFARRPYWLAVALAVSIHGFGTVVTNVWFFSATMIAAVALLLPRPRSSSATAGARERVIA